MVRTPCFHCRGPGSIPGGGTKIPQASRHAKKKKKKSGIQGGSLELNSELPYDPEIPLLGVYPKSGENGHSVRYLYANIHSSIIHNSNNVETTQVSINGQMDKQNVIHPYDGILFSRYKERNSDTHHNVDELGEHYSP